MQSLALRPWNTIFHQVKQTDETLTRSSGSRYWNTSGQKRGEHQPWRNVSIVWLHTCRFFNLQKNVTSLKLSFPDRSRSCARCTGKLGLKREKYSRFVSEAEDSQGNCRGLCHWLPCRGCRPQDNGPIPWSQWGVFWNNRWWNSQKPRQETTHYKG